MAEEDVQFPTASGEGTVRGILHRPTEEPVAGLVVTHGRSNDMRNPFVRRVASAAVDAGLLALRINFRYVDARGEASGDLSAEEGDLVGAVRRLRNELAAKPIIVAGKSMGARVCARASADPDIAGVIALGYPLHPRSRPQVTKPPEWPKLVKPALFVQGDADPFCDLDRLRGELPRLTQPYALVVIRKAGHSFEPFGGKRDTFPEVWAPVREWIAGQLAA